MIEAYPLELTAGETHLWVCPADAAPDAHVQALARDWMSSGELARCNRFVLEPDRHRYLLARLLARDVLSRYAGVPPPLLRFEASRHGRPELAGQPTDSPRVRFNITHTHGLVALAAARDAAIGIDAEWSGRDISPDLGHRVFSPAEWAAWSVLPTEQQRERSLALWTLKESYVKARGVGLSLGLDRFGFRFGGQPSIALDFPPDFDDHPQRWDVQLLRSRTDHYLAVCRERTLSRVCHSRAWEYFPLLPPRPVELAQVAATGHDATDGG